MARVAALENEDAAPEVRRGVSEETHSKLAARGHLELGADVGRYFRHVVVNEMTDTVMRDAAQPRPIAQRRNGRLFVFWKNPAGPQAEDIGELAGIGEGWRFHSLGRRVKDDGLMFSSCRRELDTGIFVGPLPGEPALKCLRSRWSAHEQGAVEKLAVKFPCDNIP